VEGLEFDHKGWTLIVRSPLMAELEVTLLNQDFDYRLPQIHMKVAKAKV
jgi:hypothetical protein